MLTAGSSLAVDPVATDDPTVKINLFAVRHSALSTCYGRSRSALVHTWRCINGAMDGYLFYFLEVNLGRMWLEFRVFLGGMWGPHMMMTSALTP